MEYLMYLYCYFSANVHCLILFFIICLTRVYSFPAEFVKIDGEKVSSWFHLIQQLIVNLIHINPTLKC